MNPELAEENARFVSDIFADTRERKQDILRDILITDEIRENDDGVVVNHSKFVYLYGPQNTGKLSILKRVAREIYGDSWESKIYIREDVGQRFPYKLHAHKVESSKRVIFVTPSRLTWVKWKELYPSMRTIEFQGSESEPDADGIVKIRYSDFFQKNQQRKEQFKNDIKNILQDVCNSLQLSNDSLHIFQERIMSRVRQDWSAQHADFSSSEVVETLV